MDLPSSGRALAILIAVCAVLWVWWMLPQFWPQLHTGGFDELFTWLQVALPLGNGVVLWWVTRPMWQSPRLSKQEELKRGFVLLLSVLFHLASLVLVAGVIMLFSGAGVGGSGGVE
ncbi:hypothetical protein [Hymenobacter sp. YC55]|uniref:hypothetical protein n=1 Tax=Hymenobacter sp. YC55 TaxID=3034019 RepID=UPI0023F706FB|nr:hypothetical protein [Hymenobacter sp. YC55]MDF7813399.1 hypothetical protein [Hymenobacter sp. YC55]